MANASTWPSANRASDRSSAAQSASAAKRARVPPEPGFGSVVPHSAAISFSSIQGVNGGLFHSVVQATSFSCARRRIADRRSSTRSHRCSVRVCPSHGHCRGVRSPAERAHRSPRRWTASCLSGLALEIRGYRPIWVVDAFHTGNHPFGSARPSDRWLVGVRSHRTLRGHPSSVQVAGTAARRRRFPPVRVRRPRGGGHSLGNGVAPERLVRAAQNSRPGGTGSDAGPRPMDRLFGARLILRRRRETTPR